MLKRTAKICLCLLLHVSVQLDHPQGAYAEPCKTTILWNWSVKVHRYMICGVVAASISGCDVCAACLKYFLPQRHIPHNNVFLLINSSIL